MEHKSNSQNKQKKTIPLGFVFFFAFATGSLANDFVNSTTNTDSNQDGKSDGNVVTIHKDVENKLNFATQVASSNLRGSLLDADCVAATGDACSSKPYFQAGNIDKNIDQLTENIRASAFNSNSRNFAGSADPIPAGIENICSRVPNTFGCLEGDFDLLASARDSVEFSLEVGDLKLPDDPDGKNFLSKMDKFISDISNVRDRVLKGFTGALNVISLNPLPSNSFQENPSLQNSPYTYEDYAKGSQEGSFSATFGKEEWVGPQNLNDMSAHIDVMNGLEGVDRQSGAFLTLWQRATRRYQNFDLSRALTLAKTEGARERTMSSRAPASVKK